MFVSKRRHEATERFAFDYYARYTKLLAEWNSLVKRINAAGGEALFDRNPPVSKLSPEEIRKLLQLCHPDKHNGKPLAVEMTQLLNSMKDNA